MTVHTLLRRLGFCRLLPIYEGRCSTHKQQHSSFEEQSSSVHDTAYRQRKKTPRKHLSPILEQQLGVSKRDISRFLETGGAELNRQLLIERLSFLREIGLDDEDIKSELSIILVPPELITTRKQILEECGVTRITIPLLVEYDLYSRAKVSHMKALGHIPQDLDVAKNILSYAGPDVANNVLSYAGVNVAFPNSRYARSGALFIRGNSLPLSELHRFSIFHYLVWFFDDRTIFNRRKLCNFMSFRTMLRALKMFQCELQLDENQVFDFDKNELLAFYYYRCLHPQDSETKSQKYQ